jgi:RES domain-containing protein
VKLWRISSFTDLSGDGGLSASGRWHSRGRPIVYLADHPALALLETIVHLQVAPLYLPEDYKLLTIDIPDDLKIAYPILPATWRTDITSTRQIGDMWVKNQGTALLEVPSILVPSAHNFVLNPLHPDASGVKVIEVQSIAFDPRLLK